MGFFNPIAYFIRQFFRYLRSITGKLFIIFVLLFFVLILYMCIDKGVFAETDIIIDDSVFTEEVINDAKSRIGDSIWNDDDYDIWLSFWGTVYYSGNVVFNNNGNDIKYGLCYSYFKYSDYSNSFDHFVINNINTKLNYYNKSFVNAYVSTNNNTSVLHYIRNIYGSSNVMGNDTSTKSNIVETGSTIINTKTLWLKPIRNHFNVYDENNNLLLEPNYNVNPYIENESSTITNWSFDYLNINSGSVGYVYVDPLLNETKYSTLYLKYKYKGITYTQPISSAYIPTWSTDNFTLEIPRTLLLNSVNIENGESVEFYLEVKQDNIGDTIYSLGSYTFSLTTEEQEQIQQDSDKAVQGEILQTQQETNNKLDNLDNSINDDKVDDMSSDFGSLGDGMTAEDNTGIDTIFQKLYDAFCNNEIQPVSLTIPFVNKSFTIDSNSVSSNFPPAVKSIVAVFVWGVIGLWVLKDIRSIIDKISEGSPEDVGSDVKKEVL